jgi:hypothetical protein
MTKGLISIFALPHEIDNLHLTLYNLRRNAEYVQPSISFTFDITLCLSDEMTDWNASSLPKEYFRQKFNMIAQTLCNWAPNSIARIEEGNSILGCVSQRRHTLQYVDDYDFTMWLDNDLFFGDKFLVYAGIAVQNLMNNPYFIITPQITRQWDTSWDVLVNKDLMNRPLNDNLVANVFHLGLSDDQVTIKQIPTFKAAGGWGTIISNKLLKLIGIPKSLGHYGLEDTYVLNCAQMLVDSGKFNVYQAVLENILVCENHSLQTTQYLRNMVAGIDRKNEFRQIAAQNFQAELQRFYNENILQNK